MYNDILCKAELGFVEPTIRNIIPNPIQVSTTRKIIFNTDNGDEVR